MIDEADRLLDDTFAEDLDTIISELPSKRQTLLFSATMTDDIKNIQFGKGLPPFIYSCNTKYDTVEKLEQKYLFIPSTVKDVYLAHLVQRFENKTIIIFAGKCR